MYSSSPKSKRVEFRCPDPSCNPYLSFAHPDGDDRRHSDTRSIQASRWTRIFYDMPPEELAEVPKAPGSWTRHWMPWRRTRILLRGDVFTDDVIKTWIKYNGRRKSTRCGCVRIRTRFCLYYDI